MKRKPKPQQRRNRADSRWLALLACLFTALPALAGKHWTAACEAGPPPSLAAPEARGTLVLIIDDLGYQKANGLAVTRLPGNFTVAVIPHTPHGRQLAAAAAAAGKEVMLHLPMSSIAGGVLDPGGLSGELSREQFQQRLHRALDDLPGARGVNNHMGSDLTQRRQQMDWLMQDLARRQLYFVDSRTSPLTVAAGRAAAWGVPHLSRHIFLDNQRSPRAIDREFQLLAERALQQGLAVGIGHPYPETIAYLRQALPAARCRGIRLALVSEVLPEKSLPPPPAALAGTGEFSGEEGSETHFNAVLGHIGLGLGHGVLTKVEDTGG